MSDRAKKNIAITDMMPQISNSWDELDLEQRDTCCRINHFFFVVYACFLREDGHVFPFVRFSSVFFGKDVD